MTKMISVIVISLFCLVISISNISFADNKVSVKMQKHIDKVKRTKPAEYQNMFNKAGGIIVDCISCHQDFTSNKRFSTKTNPGIR